MPDVPKWPNFQVRRQAWGRDAIWVASTDTGRPKTPVFSLAIYADDAWGEDEVRQVARVELDARYKDAHPNGCP